MAPNDDFTTEAFASVALSRLTTGVGGLAGDDVRPLIDRHLGDLETSVYVDVVDEAGKVANEG